MATKSKVKRVGYKNGAIGEELLTAIEDYCISMICDDDMNILISEEDWEFLKKVAPAAIDDFYEIE